MPRRINSVGVIEALADPTVNAGRPSEGLRSHHMRSFVGTVGATVEGVPSDAERERALADWYENVRPALQQ